MRLDRLLGLAICTVGHIKPGLSAAVDKLVVSDRNMFEKQLPVYTTPLPSAAAPHSLIGPDEDTWCWCARRS